MLFVFLVFSEAEKQTLENSYEFIYNFTRSGLIEEKNYVHLSTNTNKKFIQKPFINNL